MGGHSYALKQFHFHHPSEEKIKGKSYDMVIHLVHADGDGKLAVVAVLLKKGKPNSAVKILWDHLPHGKNEESAAEGVTVNAADFLPASRAYYNFMGSLTTPPCSEGVTWFVLEEPINVSAKEIAAFSKMYAMNARPTQPLGDRIVRESK